MQGGGSLVKQENREMTCIVKGKSLRRSQDPTFQFYFYSFKQDDNKTDRKSCSLQTIHFIALTILALTT